MIHEVRHREEPLPAGRTSWRNHAIPTLRYRWRLIHEGVEGVAANLGLQSAKQLRFLHSFTCFNRSICRVCESQRRYRISFGRSGSSEEPDVGLSLYIQQVDKHIL